jgi:hypothetical protein
LPDLRSTRFARLNAARMVSVPLRFFANTLELFFELGEVIVRKAFKIDEFISSGFHRSD